MSDKQDNQQTNGSNLTPEQFQLVVKQWDAQQALLTKERVRMQIENVADGKAREGVVSDVSAVLVVGLAQAIKAINSGKDLTEIKAAMTGLQPFADAVLSKLATPADMKDPQKAIDAGKVVMPYMVKGDAAKVVRDMSQLANGVSTALIASKG